MKYQYLKILASLWLRWRENECAFNDPADWWRWIFMEISVIFLAPTTKKEKGFNPLICVSFGL